MTRASVILLASLLVLPGCGDDDSGTSQPPPPTQPPATQSDSAPKKEKEGKGTTITVGGSEFGQMLFGSDKQAIYTFQRDSKDETTCYGDCADAWPPVFTRGTPRAGNGVKQSLLGTVKRRDGKLQVTYAGKPLYFYANESPGEVRCHNVNLNGGLWWVVGPNGKRRP